MKIIDWVKARQEKIKLIFVASVVVVVFVELKSISRSISLSQLQDVFSTIPYYKLLLMLIIGLLAILPTINYDVILNRILGKKPNKLYLFETSWLINTLNNIVGFGGIVSIGLRSTIYGKDSDGKEVIKAISKIFIFLMAGLSIYSLLFFVLLSSGMLTDDFLKKYWIWLIGGGLYFPLVLIATHFKNSYTGNLDRKVKFELILTSLLDWTCVIGSFVLIGLLMGVKVNIFHVVPLFIAASVIGIMSMIPGELGSFDLMMIVGLSSIGVDKEVTIAWILLYRLFYYLVPLAIGLIFSVKNISQVLNERYEQIPRALSKEFSHKVIVFFLYFSGIMLVLSATIPQTFKDYHFLTKIDPLSFHIISQFPSILLGFLLLIMGRGYAARVKRVYIPTILLLGTTLGYTFIRDFSWGIIGFLTLLLVIIVFSKSELYRSQLVYSWEMKTVDGVIFAILGLLYIVIGFYNLPAVTHNRTIGYFVFPSEKIWMSGFLAILTATIIIYFFVNYLKGKQIKVGQPLNVEGALSLLQQYGGNIDSHLIFLKDKEIFMYQNESGESTVLIQFKTFRDKCTVMGDPSGKKEDFAEAIEAFVSTCDIYGYSPVFYEVSEAMVMILHDFGYEFIKMGEEAHVDLVDFSLAGKKGRGKRAIINRLEKDEYRFSVRQPPFSDDFLNELKGVSDEWLGGRKEKGFSLGYFTKEYMQTSPIAVVQNGDGEVVAFANVIPTYTTTEGTIDLMRHSQKAPAGVMDYLFISLFSYFQELGYDHFNLGMAPLSNVGVSKKSFGQERMAYLIYNFGAHFYSFAGLRNYKSKYATKWRPRYTLYSRKNSLIYVMLTLLIIDNETVQLEE